MTNYHIIKLVLVTILLNTISYTQPTLTTAAEQCNPNNNVYGKNEMIDQLMLCALSRNFDLDFAPQGDYIKKTPKILIEQGFSNKTTILYARLSGLWSAKRASSTETGWRCDANQTTANTLIEVNGLALDVIERVEIPLHRNQHKLATYRPCRTHDVPLWMCRQSKPLYRTTKTWVNLAYFNLTLSQATGLKRPKVDKLNFVFSCPETFKQTITHSPSAMYVLAKYLQTPEASHENPSMVKKLTKRETPRSENLNGQAEVSIGHPVSYTSAQNGKGPATPPYHSSVNLIINQAVTMLRTSLDNCLQNLDSDLSLAIDHDSFAQNRFSYGIDPTDEPAASSDELRSECSSRRWIMNRIELADLANLLVEGEQVSEAQNANHSKRSQFMLRYPQDPNQLLNPYGYYQESSDGMLDDDDRN